MIKRIQVENFKSLRKIDLELGTRNVLVGPNMSGKSNIIDIFRFLNLLATLYGSGMMPFGAALSKFGGLSEVAWKGGDANGFAMAVEGAVPGTETNPDFFPNQVQGSYVEHGGRPMPKAQFRYELAVQGNQWGFAQVQHERLELSEDGKKWEAVATEQGTRFAKRADGTTITQIGNAGETALEQNISGWEGNAVRRTFAAVRFHKLVPASMKTTNPTAAAPFLQESGENLGSWLLTIQTQHRNCFDRIEMAMRDAFPDIGKLFTSPTQQTTVFVSSQERSLRRRTSVFQMSDGELAFLALLSLLYAPPELSAPLYCIEEPENHLHPRLIEVLVQLVKQHQRELPEDERATIVISTHSPLLLDQCDLDEIIVVEKQDGATVCTRPREKAHLKELLERKELGLGALYYSGALGSG